MPEVSVVVELRVAVGEEVDPVTLEEQVAAEGRRGARELYRQSLRMLDGLATDASSGARQRIEERWVATTFGRVRVWRYRVKNADRSFHPLDRALGLSQAEPSPALREAVCDFATRLPYRQVAEVTSRLIGEPFSALSAWRAVQAEGAAIRTEEAELVETVFELGEAPPTSRSRRSSWWWRPTAPSSPRRRSKQTASSEDRSVLHRKGAGRRKTTPEVAPVRQGLLRDHR